MAIRTNKLVDGKFSTSINAKDRHAVADCIDLRERRVLEFVLRILYPKKPSRVTLTMDNTILVLCLGLERLTSNRNFKK